MGNVGPLRRSSINELFRAALSVVNVYLYCLRQGINRIYTIESKVWININILNWYKRKYPRNLSIISSYVIYLATLHIHLYHPLAPSYYEFVSLFLSSVQLTWHTRQAVWHAETQLYMRCFYYYRYVCIESAMKTAFNLDFNKSNLIILINHEMKTI